MRHVVASLLCGLWLATSLSGVAAASRSAHLSVSPAVAFAPAFWRLRLTIEPNDDQRACRIEADSGLYQRATEIPLDGLAGPKTLWVEWPNMPAGTYRVLLQVATETEIVASDEQTVIVVARF